MELWAKQNWSYPEGYGAACGSTPEPGPLHCTRAKDEIASTCEAEAINEHKFEKGYAGYNAAMNAQAWCTKQFCWLSPCACNKLDQAKSTWAATEFYSHSVCGAEDVYTEVSRNAFYLSACESQSQCIWDTSMDAGYASPTPAPGIAPRCAPKTSEETFQEYSNVLGRPTQIQPVELAWRMRTLSTTAPAKTSRCGIAMG